MKRYEYNKSRAKSKLDIGCLSSFPFSILCADFMFDKLATRINGGLGRSQFDATLRQ